nr:hypothetical protein [Tanacetum cinerariifolium]
MVTGWQWRGEDVVVWRFSRGEEMWGIEVCGIGCGGLAEDGAAPTVRKGEERGENFRD